MGIEPAEIGGSSGGESQKTLKGNWKCRVNGQIGEGIRVQKSEREGRDCQISVEVKESGQVRCERDWVYVVLAKQCEHPGPEQTRTDEWPKWRPPQLSDSESTRRSRVSCTGRTPGSIHQLMKDNLEAAGASPRHSEGPDL